MNVHYANKNLLKQIKFSITWTCHEIKYFDNMWDEVAKPNPYRVGVGFGTLGPVDDDYNYFISYNLVFEYFI